MAKKPTGLSISKNGSTFSISWKRAQDYSAQQCQYATSYLGWTGISISKSATSTSVSVSNTSYVSFRVRGKKSSKWSGWKTKTFWLAVPYAPSISFSNESEKTTFSWSQYADSGIAQDFRYIEYQTAFTSESNGPVWSASSTSGATAANILYTEDSSVIATGSHSRWFRARAIGLAGASGWVTVRRVYATPNAAIVTRAEPTDDTSGINGYMAWTTSPSAEYPIDSTTVQYLMTVPAEDVSLPAGSLSWQNIGGYSSSRGADAISFETGDTLENDEVMFVRVNTQHDDRINYGEAQILKIGYLADAENVSLTDVDPAQFRVTVNATNTSEVPDSFLVVTHKTKDEEIDLAIIPHGQTSVVVQCPDWSEDQNISFGVRAVVGTATVVQTRSDGVTIYRVESKMQSKNTLWEGGTLPVLPANVTVEATSVSGSVRVGWDWTWSQARYADVSWSDHADAWESTDEPSVYRVSVVHASYWFIAGLELGKTWYVRVRLVASDGETASPWSPIESIDLSIAPSIPSLTLSASVITLEDVLTAYWSYVTLDGKAQAYAEICEATVINGIITYGDIIAHTETAQHIDINPKEVGWETGEIHRLCVRVVSSAGKSSRDWSVPVSVAIAEPIEAEITSTSLVHEEIIDNPQTFTGEIVTFESEDVAPVARHLKVALSPIQDLHGYDKPWNGGNGKNKFDYAKASFNASIPAYGFTISVSGTTVTVQGTAIGSGNRAFAVVTDYADDSLSGKGYVCQALDVSGTHTIGNAWGFRTETEKSFAIQLNNVTDGETVNVTFKISVAETSQTSWTPYSNICPIYGRAEVDAYVSGINVWDEEWEIGGINATTGATDSSTDRIRSKNFVPCKEGTSYYFTCPSVNWRMFFYDVNKEFKSYIGTYNSARVVTIPSGVAYLKFWIIGTTYGNNISINYPSTDTEYHAYQGTTHTTALGRTVYGGTLDVVSGELTVDRAMLTLNGSETWSASNGTATACMRVQTRLDVGLKPNASNTSLVGDISSAFVEVTPNQTWDGTIGFSVSTDATNPYLHFCQTGQKNMSVDAWKTYLASNPIQVVGYIATPQTIQLTAQQVALLMGTNNVWSDAGEITLDIADSVIEADVLKELPLKVTINGTGNGGTTMVIVERAEDYQMDRPDESELDGYKGETIALLGASGDGEFTIDVNDLKGRLDDGAKYNLIAIVKDNIGQMSEARIDNFEVHWTHQAIVPLATIEADETNLIAKITPIAPEGASDTDVADIYRLSVDKPELVVEGATFGTTYVDPYPALGEMGGYRVVMRTENNDYITEDNMIAWVDEPVGIKNEDLLNIIDFDGRQIKFYYDTDYSHTWTKDFEETQYLGGSIQGDWNPAISRTGTLNTKGITVLDQEMLQDVRRLAEYPGVCHIRTADGSSYSGNIEVSEDRVHDDQEMVVSYSLSITRVDNYELDGLTLEQYQAGGTE